MVGVYHRPMTTTRIARCPECDRKIMPGASVVVGADIVRESDGSYHTADGRCRVCLSAAGFVSPAAYDRIVAERADDPTTDPTYCYTCDGIPADGIAHDHGADTDDTDTNPAYDRHAVTIVGYDGRSRPMYRYTADMHLPDHARRIVDRADRPVRTSPVFPNGRPVGATFAEGRWDR